MTPEWFIIKEPKKEINGAVLLLATSGSGWKALVLIKILKSSSFMEY